MPRSERVNKILSAAFIAAEIALGVLIQLVGGRANDALSFSAVLLAFAFCFSRFSRTPPYLFTQIALLFTVMADLFLVIVEPRRQLAAMMFFNITQLAYFLRIMWEDTRRTVRIAHCSVRVGAVALVLTLTLVILGDGADAVAVVSMIYFANLLVNVAFALVNFAKAPVLAIGLVLFMLCDIFVGLSLLEGYLPVEEGTLLHALAHPGFNAAWLFYVPSQTLLSLSPPIVGRK